MQNDIWLKIGNFHFQFIPTVGTVRVQAFQHGQEHLDPIGMMYVIEEMFTVPGFKKNPNISHRKQAFLDQSIDDLELTIRATNLLYQNGIKTLGELLLKTEVGLLKQAGFGRCSLREIRANLARFGLELGMKPEEEPTDGTI